MLEDVRQPVFFVYFVSCVCIDQKSLCRLSLGDFWPREPRDVLCRSWRPLPPVGVEWWNFSSHWVIGVENFPRINHLVDPWVYVSVSVRLNRRMKESSTTLTNYIYFLTPRALVSELQKSWGHGSNGGGTRSFRICIVFLTIDSLSMSNPLLMLMLHVVWYPVFFIESQFNRLLGVFERQVFSSDLLFWRKVFNSSSFYPSTLSCLRN